MDSDPSYNPINSEFQPLVEPLNANEFEVDLVQSLYQHEFEYLTSDEFTILDFIGMNGMIKTGTVVVSFGGLRRIVSLHQARLTKALNRLLKKDLLSKEDAGYALTEEGLVLFKKLYSKFGRSSITQENSNVFHLSEGAIQGPPLAREQLRSIAENLSKKWFGKYRFTSKIEYEDSYEIFWISTNGDFLASLKLGPKNLLRLSLHASLQSTLNVETQLLIDYITQIVEEIQDAPVVFTDHKLFKNNRLHPQELDDATITFAS